MKTIAELNQESADNLRALRRSQVIRGAIRAAIPVAIALAAFVAVKILRK